MYYKLLFSLGNMISQFFILSARGNTLVFRDFRGDVVRGTAEIFYRRIKSYKGNHPPPIFHVEGTQFLFIILGGLYFVCSTSTNVSPVFVFEFLNKIALACKDYCGVLNEESICTNFTLVYEIIDEMLDFGYPQCTSTQSLRDFIVNEANNTSRTPTTGIQQNAGYVFGIEKRNVPSSAPDKSILSDDKSLKKNEVYIDILERLTVTISATGHVVCSDIDGCIKVRSFLTGNPEIRMSLNDVIRVKYDESNYNVNSHGGLSVVLDDCRFHECVNVEEFNRYSSLVFRPPSGESIVMKYHTVGDLQLPFRVYPILEVPSETQIKLQLKISCEVPKIYHAVGITLHIPVPKSTTNVVYDSSSGANRFEYNQRQKCISWAIQRMNGCSEHHADIRITVPLVTKMCQKEISPVTLDFEFPMFVCSKLEIKSLKVVERNSMYTAMRWVRCITHSDSYVIRL